VPSLHFQSQNQKKIFHSCQKHVDVVTLYNQLWSLFPNGDDPELVKELLQHPEAIRDEAYRKCNSLEHKIWYARLVESGLKSIRRKSWDDKMPKNKNHLLFARARARDWHHAIEPDKDKMLIPSSTIQAERKRKSGNK
jgi:hypothetical protein